MGQYRFFVSAKWQIGFLLKADQDFFEVHIPFLQILFGLQKTAHGAYIFGFEI